MGGRGKGCMADKSTEEMYFIGGHLTAVDK